METFMIVMIFLSIFWKVILFGAIIFIIIALVLGSMATDKVKNTIQYFDNPNREPINDKICRWMRESDSDIAEWFRRH